MKAPTLLILAAGMGSRYGGLKQLDPIGPAGETLLDYSVYDAIQAGFGRVVFVIRRDFEGAFRKQVIGRFKDAVKVEYVFQERADLPRGFTLPEGRTKPWGTAHAVRAAREVIDGPFAMINADDFYGRDSYRQLADFLQRVDPSAADYAMAGFELRRTLSEHGSVSRGVCEVDDQGRLRSVVEMTRIVAVGDGAENREEGKEGVALDGSEFVSMNMWGFTPAFLPQLEKAFVEFLEKSGEDPGAECYVPDVVDGCVRRGEANVRVLATSSQWFGVTYREDRQRVAVALEQLAADGVYPEPLWKKR